MHLRRNPAERCTIEARRDLGGSRNERHGRSTTDDRLTRGRPMITSDVGIVWSPAKPGAGQHRADDTARPPGRAGGVTEAVGRG